VVVAKTCQFYRDRVLYHRFLKVGAMSLQGFRTIHFFLNSCVKNIKSHLRQVLKSCTDVFSIWEIPHSSTCRAFQWRGYGYDYLPKA